MKTEITFGGGAMSFLMKIGTKRPAKIHEIKEGRPLCGVGKAIRAWQEDIGPANCGSCKRILAAKERKEHKGEVVEA
jgi:hypothetical protein